MNSHWSADIDRIKGEWRDAPQSSRGVALEFLSISFVANSYSKEAREATEWLIELGGLSPLAHDLAVAYLADSED